MNREKVLIYARGVSRVGWISTWMMLTLVLMAHLFPELLRFSIVDALPYLIAIVSVTLVAEMVAVAGLLERMAHRRKAMRPCPECRVSGGVHKMRCGLSPSVAPVSAPLDACPTFPVPSQEPLRPLTVEQFRNYGGPVPSPEPAPRPSAASPSPSSRTATAPEPHLSVSAWAAARAGYTPASDSSDSCSPTESGGGSSSSDSGSSSSSSCSGGSSGCGGGC